MITDKVHQSAYSNPLYQRLTSGAKPPTLAQTARLTSMLFAISLVLVILRIITSLRLFELAAIILCAPIVGGVGAAISASDAQKEVFILLKITALPRAVIVRGYSLVALFRTCLLIALLIGLLPMMFDGTMGILSQSSIRQANCHVFLQRNEIDQVPANIILPCASPRDIRFVLEDFIKTVLFVVPAFAVPASVVFGVLLGLDFKRPLPAAGVSIVVLSIVSFSYIALLALFSRTDRIMLNCKSPMCPIYHVWTDYTWLATGMLLIVSLVTLAVNWLARRGVMY